MNEYMQELVSIIESAGITVTNAYFTEDNHIQIDVDPEDEEKALAAVEAHFKQKQQSHIEHIGLIAVPMEEGETQ